MSINKTSSSTGIIILAAGNSSRLGRPKQLLEFQHRSLLARVSDAAVKSSCSPVLVVLGAYADQILASLPADVPYIINVNWETGMAGSIVTGLHELIKRYPDLENIIFAVSDQAFITPENFGQLLDGKNKTEKGIIASSYAQTMGTPVLFSKQYFHQLLSLKGNQGAKAILSSNQHDVETVSFQLGYIDIDTEQDYINLTSHL